MKFTATELEGAWLIEEERLQDSRGWFARAFCAEEFARRGLEPVFPQINHSCSLRAATLRGLHYQREPHAEVKVVCCLRGAFYDVIVDIRPDSATFRRWQGIELRAGDGRWLYVPKGFAHGFLTLEDNTEALYLVSAPYTPGAEGGLRYDDPALSIRWPRAPEIISAKDAAWPLIRAAS